MDTKRFVLPVLALALVGVSGAALYFYQQANVPKQDPTVAAQQEVATTVAKVGKLIALPEGEVPTVATVSDPEKLRDQPFFAKAKAGDKVLLYTNAKMVYLYDPVLNKILEVAPVNAGTMTGTTNAPLQKN